MTKLRMSPTAERQRVGFDSPRSFSLIGSRKEKSWVRAVDHFDSALNRGKDCVWPAARGAFASNLEQQT
jgi:hypothetical protein